MDVAEGSYRWKSIRSKGCGARTCRSAWSAVIAAQHIGRRSEVANRISHRIEIARPEMEVRTNCIGTANSQIIRRGAVAIEPGRERQSRFNGYRTIERIATDEIVKSPR